jgi:hypothetical protein
MTRVIATAAALTFTALACTHAGGPTDTEQVKPQPPASAAAQPAPAGSDAKTIAGFNQRLKEYADLHNKIEKTLPPLPRETNPAAIDKHQRELEALIREHRKTARRGDIFTPDMERLIRRVCAQVFSGAEGAKLKATVMDENPADVKLAVNSRYPDEIPLSTMPPQVLAMLPKLPDDLEYRFIGSRLILLDVHAHTIADYIENALP